MESAFFRASCPVSIIYFVIEIKFNLSVSSLSAMLQFPSVYVGITDTQLVYSKTQLS